MALEANYYNLLGIPQHASEDDIKIAYKKLAKKYHPDKHAGNNFYEEHFKKINAAYQVLSDPEKRKRYDLKLHYYQNKTQNPTPTKSRSGSFSRKNKTPPKKKMDPVQQKKFRKYTTITVIFILIFLSGTIWFYNYMNGVSARHHLEEAKIQEEKKFYVMAFEEYSAAIRFDKKLYEAYEGRGDLRIKIFKDFQGAIRDYSNALMNPAPSDTLYFKRAKSYLKLKEYEAGIEDLDSAISINANYDSLYFYRAEVNHFIKQNFNTAIPDYNKIIQLNNEFSDAWRGRALCLLNTGEYKSSLHDFNKAIQLDPEEKSNFYYRAFSKLGLKDSSGACDDFFQAERLNFHEARKAINTYCIGY